ncbi:MAG: hypothetical protein Q4B03_04435 [Lachnospiraceae bacterium]|nr:hypothetical protein [Lachnospiraceae bacterium]
MAEWYPNLYLGENAGKKKRKLKAQIERGRFYPGLYLITEAANGVDQLDIVDSKCILQERAQELLPPVVGMAIGYREALEVLTDIARETYEHTGTGNVLAYVRQKAGRTT